VTQSNARYQARDTLTFNVNYVRRVVREVRSTDAMHRAMPAQLFPHASWTTLGSPAMSVTDILGTSLTMKFHKHLKVLCKTVCEVKRRCHQCGVRNGFVNNV